MYEENPARHEDMFMNSENIQKKMLISINKQHKSFRSDNKEAHTKKHHRFVARVWVKNHSFTCWPQNEQIQMEQSFV